MSKNNGFFYNLRSFFVLTVITPTSYFYHSTLHDDQSTFSSLQSNNQTQMSCSYHSWLGYPLAMAPPCTAQISSIYSKWPPLLYLMHMYTVQYVHMQAKSSCRLGGRNLVTSGYCRAGCQLVKRSASQRKLLTLFSLLTVRN